MAISITLTRRENKKDGSFVFHFSDNSVIEFISAEDLAAYSDESMLDMNAKESLRQMLVAWSGRNKRSVGKTATFDIASNSGNIVRIQ